MTWEEFVKMAGYDPADIPSSVMPMLLTAFDKSKQNGQMAGAMASNGYKKGDYGTAIDFQGLLASNGIQMTPEQSKWLDNEVNQQVVNEAREYNTDMRDSSLTSASNQLASLGLNPASVLQTGGAGIGSSPVADTSKSNPSLEKAMASFNQKAALTRTLLGLLGGLGSAGILGSTRLLARKAASVAAASAANSGIKAITGQDEKLDWNSLVNELDKY